MKPLQTKHRRRPNLPLRRRPQDMEDLRSVSNRPPLINDQPHDTQPSNRSKNRISVKHEDLRTEPRELDNSTPHRKSSSFQALTHQPTCLGPTTRRMRSGADRTVRNVVANG